MIGLAFSELLVCKSTRARPDEEAKDLRLM